MPRVVQRFGAFVLVVLLLVFAGMTTARARLWTHQKLLSLDSATRYPEGRVALTIRARQHAQTGDVTQAMGRLRETVAAGHDQFQLLLFDPGLAPIANEPEFLELIAELAGRYTDRIGSLDRPTAQELGGVSRAHFARGEFDAAVAALERAAARGGATEAIFIDELAHLRALVTEIENDRAP